VVFSEPYIKILENTQINDSKKLSAAKREQLYEYIVNNCLSYAVITITNKEIDDNWKKEGSLNDLELEAMAKLIIRANPDVVFIDALGRNLMKFKQRLTNLINSQNYPVPEIITEYKADEKYKVVGAASILAKVQRDQAISESCSEFDDYGEIGSGYPSDDKTIAFLRYYIKKNHHPPEIARTSWQTCRDLMDELVHQKKLDQFF
jgi:ribonuclease HII